MPVSLFALGGPVKVVIVGGGLVGLLSAWELVQTGASVTILEKNASTGQESSWAGGGILSPLYPWRYSDPVNQLARWSQAHYPALVEAIEDVSGMSAEFRRSGLLVLDEAEFARGQAWSRQYASEISLLGDSELAELAPGISSQQAAMYFPQVGQIRNPCLVKSLRHALLSLGVEFLDNRQVDGFVFEQERLVSVRCAEQVYSADQFLLTAGAWTGALLESLHQSAKIEPVRGQMLLFQGSPGQLESIVLHNGRYLVPRQDGLILAGSTMEKVGFDRSTTSEAFDSIKQFANSCFPPSRKMPIIRHWSGFRPGSEGGVPLIGAVSPYTNLFVNSGHFRNGVVMAPASAKLLINIMLSQEPILPPGPYQIKSASLTTEI